MRSLQFSGKPIEISPNRLYNCSYLPIDHVDSFSECMFLLLSGCGAGDKWCLGALRWKEAMMNNFAPKVILEATNEKTLEVIEMKDLLKHSHKKTV